MPQQPPVSSNTLRNAYSLRRAAAFFAQRKVAPLLWALLLQGLLILATLWVLVFRTPQEEVRFLPVNTGQLSPQTLPRQTLLSQMARSSGNAALQSLSETAALPLPDAIHNTSQTDAAFTAPGGVFSPLAGSIGAAAIFSTEGIGTDAATAIGTVLEVSQPVSFFGIEEQSERYLILLDTSNSMFVRSRSGTRYRYDFGQIKKETARLLQSFNANTQFNIIVYEGGAWAWQQELQTATLPVREQAQNWVNAIGENPSLSIRDRRGEGPLLMEGGGTRLDTALKLAFETYEPQVVFIVTDGEINSIPGGRITEETIVGQIRSLQAQQTHPARIHVVYFKTAQMREVELQTLRAIARQGRGRFTEVIANTIE